MDRRPHELTTRAALIGRVFPGVAMVEDHSAPDRDTAVGRNIRGTAFAADARGYFLTAKHVVRGISPANLELRTNYSRNEEGGYAMAPCRSIQAIYPHPLLDLAIIAVPVTFSKGRVRLPLRAAVAAIGEEIVLVGYAQGTDLVFCDDMLGVGSPKSFSPVAFNGMICARVPDDGRRVQLYAYDCTTFGGNSGGPVVSTSDGAILGVHARGMVGHIGYAVPAHDCLDFLDAVAAAHEPRRPSNRAGAGNCTSEHVMTVAESGDDTAIPRSHFVAEAAAAADAMAQEHGLPIAYQHVQGALEEVCGGDGPEYLLCLRLTRDQIGDRLATYPFPRLFPEVVADVRLDHSALPPGTTRRLDERAVRVHGEVWRIHKNDADPFPSNPHGHNLETGHKLHLGTGELYLRNRPDGKIDRKDLLAIRRQLYASALPSLQV